MIKPESLDLLALPSMPLSERKSFPAIPCIYFAIDSLNNVQYIGKTKNLRKRWKYHHKPSRLEESESIQVAYLLTDIDLLDRREIELIEMFNPPLNAAYQFSIVKGIGANIESESIADSSDLKLCAKHISSQWASVTKSYYDFILSPSTQPKIDLAIARLQSYIEQEKKNSYYKYHAVTYIAFPLDLSDYTAQNFAPYFSLEINYGEKRSCFVHFLIK